MSTAMPPLASAEACPWRRAAAWLLFLAPFFFITYGLANWSASQRADVPSLVFEWEHAIPFWAWTILPYWSIDALYGLSLFVCLTRHELDTHAKRLLTAQAIAITCFVLVPLRFAFAHPAADGVWGLMFDALAGFDQPFNQLPSLHIALAVILWALYARRLSGIARLAMELWFLLICGSVLTTYQHHFIDIPTGLLLGALCLWAWPFADEGNGRAIAAQWQWTRDMEWYKGKWDYAIYTTRTLTPHQIASGQFPPKEAIHVIEADGVPLAAILKSHDHYLADAYPQLYSRSFDSAIVNLKKAIAWNPNNEEAHRVLGGVYVNMLDETNARIHLKKALELLPENYEVYDLLGLIEFNKKNYEPAIKLFHKSYGLKINYAMAYYHAATSYMNMQKYAEAIPEYENCIKQNGKLPEIYMALGQAYFLTGNYAKCVEAETNAVNLRQEMPQAYQIMRDAYTRMGNQEMAQACTQMIEKLQSMGVH